MSHMKKRNDDRQVSFIDMETSWWLMKARQENLDGLCINRFWADHETEGVCGWKPGDIVSVYVDEMQGSDIMIPGDWKEFEITIVGKKCFSECSLRQRTGEGCPLSRGVAFGRATEEE